MLGLKELTEINAVSGDEGEIRRAIIGDIEPYADSITVDSMGSIIAFKKGRKPNGKRILFSAHMDEVGFIVSEITEAGYIKFKSVGGIDDRIKLCQRVTVGRNKIPGVMGIKAVHLQSPEERKSVIKEKDMYIDIGASDMEEASKLVSKGDYIAFDSPYRESSDGMVKAKALDDRVGCLILMELIRCEYDADIYFCFATQEEVGVRGATALSRRICADVALILESTTSSDTPGSKDYQYSTTLGKGPAVSLMDRGSVSDRELNKFIVSLADKNAVEYQFKESCFGGNDARAYQTASLPCKTAVISLPCRYIHSPVSCASLKDLDSMKKLAGLVAENIHLF